MGQHKILLGNSPCPQNHFWALQSAHPVPQPPRGHSQAAVTSPESRSPFPGHSFGLTRAFLLLWVSWLGVPSELSSTPGPGCFSCSRANARCREGVRGRVRALRPRQRDSGSRGASGGGCRAPPTSAPHPRHPGDAPQGFPGTLNVTLAINTWGHGVTPKREDPMQGPGYPTAPPQGRMSGTLPQGARVGRQSCLPCK